MHVLIPDTWAGDGGVATVELVRLAEGWEVRMITHTIVNGRNVAQMYVSREETLTDMMDGIMTDLQYLWGQLRKGGSSPVSLPPPPNGEGK